MWRLHVLRSFLADYDLVAVGLAMLDGSYYEQPDIDDGWF